MFLIRGNRRTAILHLLTIAAASYLGGMAGMRLGASFGLWAGLIAGMLVAFLAAWGARKLWGMASVYLLG